VSVLPPGALDTVISPKELGRAIVDEGMLAGPLVSRIQELWAGMTRGYCLVYLPLTHNYEHIGQADLLRGLLGRPGPFQRGDWTPLRVDGTLLSCAVGSVGESRILGRGRASIVWTFATSRRSCRSFPIGRLESAVTCQCQTPPNSTIRRRTSIRLPRRRFVVFALLSA
jgi:hypothetical protein